MDLKVATAATTRTMESRLRRGCILYFFLFMSHGVVGPFLPLIWQDKGFTDREVGMLGSIRPGVSFLALPAVCALADRSGMPQQALYALLVLYGFSRPLVLAAGSILTVAALEVMASISEAPANSLVDTGARRSLGASGYGKMRMWGGLGFGVASVIGGYTFDVGSGGYNDVMITFVGLTVLTIVAATMVPIGKNATGYNEADDPSGKAIDDGVNAIVHGQTPELEICERGDEIERGATSAASSRTTATDRGSTPPSVGNAPVQGWLDVSLESNSTIGGDGDEELVQATNGADAAALSPVWRALRTVDAVSFLATVVLSAMGSGVIDTFLFIRLEGLGGSHTLFGIARLVMCLAEVPFFHISGPMLRRVGPRGVAAIAQIGFITRFVYYAVLRDPWWVLPAEVLHGLTFAVMWSAAIEYAHDIAPVGSEATMVGVVSGLHQGLGVGLGALMGGYLYAGLGASLCFLVCAALPCISLLLLALPAVLRCLHIGGGNERKEGMTVEEGLEGWGAAQSCDTVVPDAKPSTGSERHDGGSDGINSGGGNSGVSGKGRARKTSSGSPSARVASE